MQLGRLGSARVLICFRHDLGLLRDKHTAREGKGRNVALRRSGQQARPSQHDHVPPVKGRRADVFLHASQTFSLAYRHDFPFHHAERRGCVPFVFKAVRDHSDAQPRFTSATARTGVKPRNVRCDHRGTGLRTRKPHVSRLPRRRPRFQRSLNSTGRPRSARTKKRLRDD